MGLLHLRQHWPTADLALPVLDYGHAGNGCSVTGGYVYRGEAYPAINGVYFFADFCSGNVWAYWRPSSGDGRMELVLPKVAAISSFGEDEAGELYVTDFGGGVVYRLMVGGCADARMRAVVSDRPSAVCCPPLSAAR